MSEMLDTLLEEVDDAENLIPEAEKRFVVDSDDAAEWCLGIIRDANKEIEKAKNGLRIVEGKLNNEKFVSKAPEAVVAAEKEKAAKYAELIAKLEESAKAMQA